MVVINCLANQIARQILVLPEALAPYIAATGKNRKPYFSMEIPIFLNYTSNANIGRM